MNDSNCSTMGFAESAGKNVLKIGQKRVWAVLRRGLFLGSQWPKLAEILGD